MGCRRKLREIFLSHAQKKKAEVEMYMPSAPKSHTRFYLRATAKNTMHQHLFAVATLLFVFMGVDPV